MKKIFMVILLASIHYIAVSQKKINFAGSYFGGDCRWGYCGNWYLRNDSTCMFIQFDNRDSMIHSLGIGTWAVEADSNIRISFLDQGGIIPSLTSIKYSAENKYSPDSIYYQGTTKFYKNVKDICEGQTKSDCFQGYIGISNKEKIPVRNGSFYSRRKREDLQKKISGIVFWAPPDSMNNDTGGDIKMNFLLSPNHNYHQIDIITIRPDSTYIEAIEPHPMRTAIKKGKKKNGQWVDVADERSILSGLVAVPELKAEMIREVEQAMIKQPLYGQYLKKCLNILQDK
jgi:hypothetical protein